VSILGLLTVLGPESPSYSLRPFFLAPRGARLLSNEQRTPLQGNKDYNPRRQGIAAYRDPGGFYVYLVAVRLTLASLPYLAAGVSSSPGPEPLSHTKGGGGE